MSREVTMQEIQAFRQDCDKERDAPIRVSSYVQADYSPLEKVPDIKLQFIVGGGIFMTFDYRVIGGPDDGKRVTLVPWRDRRSLKDIAERYNGTPEEAEAAYGYSSRPALQMVGTLHISTIMFIRGLLSSEREHLMARELSDMYNAPLKAD